MFKYEITVSRDLKIKEATVHFPEVYRVAPVTIPYKTMELTARQCELNILKFIHRHINAYVNKRERAYIESGTYTSQRKLTIDRIRFRLGQCQEGRLLKLTKGVSNIQLSLQKIQPSYLSRHYQNYKTKIKPLIDWCIATAERQHIPSREAL